MEKIMKNIIYDKYENTIKVTIFKINCDYSTTTSQFADIFTRISLENPQYIYIGTSHVCNDKRFPNVRYSDVMTFIKKDTDEKGI